LSLSFQLYGKGLIYPMLSDKYHASSADLRPAQMIVSFQQGMSQTGERASREMSILSSEDSVSKRKHL